MIAPVKVVEDCSTEGDAACLVRDVGGDALPTSASRSTAATSRTSPRASGGRARHIVHLLHDDDALREGSYERLGGRPRRRAGAASCRSLYVDPDGR